MTTNTENINWECVGCGFKGSDYPRTEHVPARAVLIRLHGCDKCDPHGEDSHEYFDSAGMRVPIEEAWKP